MLAYESGSDRGAARDESSNRMISIQCDRVYAFGTIYASDKPDEGMANDYHLTLRGEIEGVELKHRREVATHGKFKKNGKEQASSYRDFEPF